MRIALAVEGSRGDVHPMLALGDRLRARGHEVVVCAPPDMRAEVEERGMELRPVGLDVHEGLIHNANALLAGGPGAVRAAYAWFRSTTREQLTRLPELTRDVDRIIGASIQIGGPSAAELHGIPYRYVVFSPVLLPSAEHPPMVIATQTLPRWVNSLAWKLFVLSNDLALKRLLNEHRARLGLAPVADTNEYLIGERPVVAVDRELARVPEDCPIEVEQIDCLHAMEGEPLPPKLEAFLAEGPPPVYIGFGSMPDPSPASSTRLVLEALDTVGCRALISEGWGGLGEGPLPEGVLRIGSVTHAYLFPRVAAVVHHGGAGTTTTALRCGVPQLLVPHAADQFYWGRRIEALGVGPPALPRRRLTAQALAETLAATLDNEWLRSRAAQLRDEGRARRASEPDPVDRFV
jgi:UDP:flavonoid glycosyltransferase YjiC (YdhE family)